MSAPTRKRLTREESQAQTREHLLAAAKRLFVSQGFGAASIRDITTEAGYSQGAFYSNFSSKEAVLLELLGQHMEEEARQLSNVLAPHETPGENALARLDRWAATLNSDADWSMLAVELQLHANRSAAFAESYLAVRSRHQKRLGAFVAHLFEELNLVPPAPPEDLAAGFMALAHGLAVGRGAGGPDPAGKLIMVFLRGLLADAQPVGRRAGK